MQLDGLGQRILGKECLNGTEISETFSFGKQGDRPTDREVSHLLVTPYAHNSQSSAWMKPAAGNATGVSCVGGRDQSLQGQEARTE